MWAPKCGAGFKAEKFILTLVGGSVQTLALGRRYKFSSRGSSFDLVELILAPCVILGFGR